ncbi:hypothetical protein [Plasmodium yoelii yoelii]|nr:hypothetical protein [Plasmodium yoelii yoelii]
MRGYMRNGYRSHSRYATASDGSSKRQGSYNRKNYYSKKPQNKDKGVTFCPHYTIKG